MIRQKTSECSNQSSQARSTIQALGLPGSLEAFKNKDAFPESIWLKIEKVQKIGGLKELKYKCNSLKDSADHSNETLSHITATLDRVEKQDAEFRERHPEYAKRGSMEGEYMHRTSQSLTDDLRQNHARLQNAFSVALSNDSVVTGIVESDEYADDFVPIGYSKDQLSDMMATVAASKATSSSTQSQYNTETLERGLVEMTQLLEKRESSLQLLINLATHDRTNYFMQSVYVAPASGCASNSYLTQAQAQEKASNQVDVDSATVLGTFAEHLVEQERILDGIMQASSEFNTAMQSGAAREDFEERSKSFSKLEKVIADYFQCLAQITAGITFYSTLQVFGYLRFKCH